MSRWLPILILFTTLSARADGLAEPLTVAGIAEFTAAYQAWDGPRFARRRNCSGRRARMRPRLAPISTGSARRSFIACCNCRTLPANRTNAARRRGGASTPPWTRSTIAVKLDERHAESHALLGTLYGMKINGSLLRAAWFGPRVAKHRNWR